ncbi:hypothetical protein HHI36_001543, partial [Cryptolaemus montrouzieri]
EGPTSPMRIELVSALKKIDTLLNNKKVENFNTIIYQDLTDTPAMGRTKIECSGEYSESFVSGNELFLNDIPFTPNQLNSNQFKEYPDRRRRGESSSSVLSNSEDTAKQKEKMQKSS